MIVVTPRTEAVNLGHVILEHIPIAEASAFLKQRFLLAS
jgi:hypothetical protein